MKWYNIELDKDSALAFQAFLIENEIAYEPSECFNLIHFEILLNDFSLATVNKWLDENIG